MSLKEGDEPIYGFRCVRVENGYEFRCGDCPYVLPWYPTPDEAITEMMRRSLEHDIQAYAGLPKELTQ